MKRWKRQTRLGVIVLASFVLLVTVLPQIATAVGLGSLANRLDSSVTCSSSSGSSGSSDSSSSTCCGSSGSSGSSDSSSSTCSGPVGGTGQVTGTVTVTGAPKGFVPPFSGVGACPYTGTQTLCTDPQNVLTENGSYTITLTAGTWLVDGFYENNPYGGAFLGTPVTVTITPGGTAVENFNVPYVKPATLHGTVKVTGVPSGVTVQSISVLLCPSAAPYTGGTAPLTCVNSSDSQLGPRPTSGKFDISGLPSYGTWIAYPGYCTAFGCTTSPSAGQTVTLVAGKGTRVALSIPFTVPDQGLLDATVSVTGAPAGFSPTVGISACQILSSGGFCEEISTFGGQSVSLLLGDGTWQVSGLYFAPVFDNPIVGPAQNITIRGGQTTAVTLDVPYQVLGTATGSIKVTGRPAGAKITAYTVMACPTPGTVTPPFIGLSCVEEYSGPGGFDYGIADAKQLGKAAPKATAHPKRVGRGLNAYNLPTLTPGQWTLYAGYQTAFGSSMASTGTTVTITAGGTTTHKLTVPYQTPSVGAVSGKVSVTGAPLGGFSAGVRACKAAPVASSCPGEQDAEVQADGSYQLALAPGTWWVSGFAYVYGSGLEATEVFSPSRQVTVVAGSKVTERFKVPVS